MVRQKRIITDSEELNEVTEQDNEEISLNTKTLLIREFFDDAENIREVFVKLDELDATLEDLIQFYKLSKPIENGCAEFERKNWINHGDRGWKEAVEVYNEHNKLKINV